jgi:outer membrane protein TolC
MKIAKCNFVSRKNIEFEKSMELKKILLIGCFVFGLFTAVFAQEETSSGEKLSLSLDEAKDYALSYNRQLQSSDLSIQKAEKAKWQSISTMLPSANASLNYSNYLGHQLNFGGMPIDMPAAGDLTVQVSVAFSGMMIVGVQMSKLAVEMSNLNRDLTELDVKANVTTAYFSVLIAEESKKLIESSRENLQKMYNSTVKLYEVGMTEQTDVDQLEVQLGTLDNTIRMTERNIELAYNSLRLILGSDDAEIELTETLDNFLADTGNAYEIMTMQLDLNENYNVRLLNQKIALSKKQVSLNKWEFGPTLSAFYQYYDRTTFNKEEGLNMNPPHVIGATLSLPLFSGGGRLSKVQQAKFDVKIAELSKADAIESLLVQEKQLRFNLRSAIETYELQKKNVSVYERIFKNASQKYELGTISSTELTTINTNLITAQTSYINALMDMLTAQTELQKLLNNF